MVVRPSVELGIFNDFTMLPTSVIQPFFPSTISQAIQTKTTYAVLKMKFMSIVISPYWQMIAVKQELERAEERIELVEYRSAERASEIEEGLDSYVTRVRHMHSQFFLSWTNQKRHRHLTHSDWSLFGGTSHLNHTIILLAKAKWPLLIVFFFAILF